MTETHHTFCRICEALCGLEVDVAGGRVVDIRPDWGRFMKGWDAVNELVREWTPARVAEVTHVSAATLEKMVKAYAEADGAALYSCG